MDLRSLPFRRPHLAEQGYGVALGVVLLPGEAVAPDFHLELLGERVHAADADAVQAAGDLVVGGVELAASVQHGQHDLDGRHDLAGGQRLVVDGNAAAVVDDGDGVVDVDGDVDARGVASKRLVDGVVDDLIDEMMQAHLARRPDIHGRAQADRSEAFEDGDVFSGVASRLDWSRRCGGRRWGLAGGGGGGNIFRHERDAPIGSG